MSENNTPRCLAWVEGQGRCKNKVTLYSEYAGPYCEGHEESHASEWTPCYECNRWALYDSEADRWYCRLHWGRDWLWPDHAAAEQGLEAAESLASWLRAVVAEEYIETNTGLERFKDLPRWLQQNYQFGLRVGRYAKGADGVIRAVPAVPVSATTATSPEESKMPEIRVDSVPSDDGEGPLSYEAVEQYIRGLAWSPDAPDIQRTLVAGNIRGFASWLRAQLQAQPAPRCATTFFCPETPEEGVPLCRNHRCTKDGCGSQRYSTFHLCRDHMPTHQS